MTRKEGAEKYQKEETKWMKRKQEERIDFIH